MKDDAALSISWTEPEIADRQRELVDRQLEAMRNFDAPAHFEVVGTIMGWLKKHSRAAHITLLDAGCASAYYHEILEYYLPGFIKYTGLDFSERMLEIAREHYPTISLIQRDLRTLGKLGAKTYQVVMSGAALMHIREWRSVLEQFARLSSNWLLLHRTWLRTEPGPTQMEIRETYGHCAWFITFEYREIIDILDEAQFVQIHSLASGEDAGEGRAVRTMLFERRGPSG